MATKSKAAATAATKEKKCKQVRAQAPDETLVNAARMGEVVPNMDEAGPCQACGGRHGTMVMGMHAGTAGEDKRYDLAFGLGMTALTVHDNVSKREFRLGWDEVVKLAIERGLNGGPFENNRAAIFGKE